MIDVLDAIYRTEAATHQQWIARVVRAAMPHLDHGLGVWGFLIDTRRSIDRWAGPLVSRDVPRDLPTALRDYLATGFATMPRRLLETAFRRPAPRVAAGSELAGGVPLRQFPPIADLARRLSFDDSIGVRAGDPRGLGCFIGAFTPNIVRTTPAFRRRWSRIGAHLTAVMRLRTARKKTEDAAFQRNGRPIRVSDRAIDHVAQLREAVVNRERARSSRLRAHSDEALELWPALVAGRWSLLDGAGGRCRALWNPPLAHSDVSLSRLEHDVATLVAIGHTNKLVAYELGIAEGTVSAIVHRLRLKLDAGSRSKLVAACARLEEARSAPRTSALLDLLAPGEREVARAAAEGFSNAAIAASRGHSVRTTENMLASAYRKLGVRSRAELVARLLT